MKLKSGIDDQSRKALLMYSEGRISIREVCNALSLRDNVELMILLSQNEIEPPRPHEDQVEAQAEIFADILRLKS